MSYTIVRSNGNTLTTIQDGTINTTSTSLALPGRNYAGYGQTINTNLVRLSENFASATPPTNALKGQLWFNTTNGTMNVCPKDGESNALAWFTLASTTGGGDTAFTHVTVSEAIDTFDLTVANSATVTGSLAVTSTVEAPSSINLLQVGTLTVNETASISGLVTQSISTGSSTNSGVLTGSWTVTGNAASGGKALSIASGDISFAIGASNGIKCDNYMYANGVAFNPQGQYGDSNVSTYLTGAAGHTQFTGNIAPSVVTTGTLAAKNNGLGQYLGTITGTWSLGTGAKLNATYADLAERYEADALYTVGTVLALGGDKEVTIADELSDQVFGVVSDSYAYLLNEAAGTDETHPPIALAGRVTVKVIGKVNKHDRLVSAGNGFARVGTKEELTAFNSIGRALTSKDTDGEGTVTAVVVIK